MTPSKFRQALIKLLIILPIFVLLVLPPSLVADQAQFIYDELGRLQAVTDGQGNTAIYTYDAVGNLLAITRRVAGEVAILSIIPSAGPVGTPVTINGIGFSATPTNNQVSFSGGVNAVVLSSTTTSISTVVPDGALTGLVTVTTPTGSAVSPRPFLLSPTLTGIAPGYGLQASTITEFRVTGVNLQGSSVIKFAPSDGISVTSPPTISADGTTAVVGVTIADTASLSLRTVTITNPGGTSSPTATDQNTFLVLPSQPLIVDSGAVGVFVEPSPDESFGTMVHGTDTTVGVFVEPSPAESFGTMVFGTDTTVGVFVEPSPAESFGTMVFGTNTTVGVFVEPNPNTVLAPYVGVQTAP